MDLEQSNNNSDDDYDNDIMDQEYIDLFINIFLAHYDNDSGYYSE